MRNGAQLPGEATSPRRSSLGLVSVSTNPEATLHVHGIAAAVYGHVAGCVDGVDKSELHKRACAFGAR